VDHLFSNLPLFHWIEDTINDFLIGKGGNRNLLTTVVSMSLRAKGQFSNNLLETDIRKGEENNDRT
jgi:hypothetical protein